jgi:hypothetical protein
MKVSRSYLECDFHNKNPGKDEARIFSLETKLEMRDQIKKSWKR